MGNEYDGLYVAIEGLDGAGTTTVAESLGERFPDAVLTAEPYDDIWTGEAVRTALTGDTAPTTDLFLVLADRSEHLERVVKPALEEGRTVISDRSADSTYAYQARRVSDVATGGAGEGPWSWFDEMYGPWDVEPDLTIWLDVSVATALERMDGDEKYERRDALEVVRDNYRTLAGLHDDRYVPVDAEAPVGEVVSRAAAEVEARGGD